MATAALAYKCMEVAYMRVVYCKNMSASRVWHDLQASLQMPIPLQGNYHLPLHVIFGPHDFLIIF